MRALALACWLVSAAAGALPAVTYHLDAAGTGDFPTISAAIYAAESGDSILLAAGLYLGPANTRLSFAGRDIVLAGAGPGATILDCEDSGVRAVRFENGETRAAVLRDLTLRNNKSRNLATGLYINGSSPTIANVHLEDFDGDPPCWDCVNFYTGAALRCIDGSPRIQDLVIRDGSTAGGAYIAGGAPELERVLIEYCSNMERHGGGLELGPGNAILRGVTVRECEAIWSMGGGVYCAGSPSPTFEDCRFENNFQGSELPGGWYSGGGGGMCCWNSSPILKRCTFIGNEARNGGGGLACFEFSTPLLEELLFVDNRSAAGASALVTIDSAPILRGVTITGSRFPEIFGHEIGTPSSIICAYGAPVIESVIVALNDVGVGLFTEEGGYPVISCSDFFANPGGNYGGTLADQTGLNGNISADPLFCDAPGGDFTLDAASPCLPANNDCHVQMGAFGWGCGTTAAEESAPAAFAFAPPQPNPFNPKTTLRFALPRAAAVDLVIFDVNGRQVRRLLAGEQRPAGHHALDWNGRDEAGRALPSGVYFARFAAGGFTAEHKLVLLR